MARIFENKWAIHLVTFICWVLMQNSASASSQYRSRSPSAAHQRHEGHRDLFNSEDEFSSYYTATSSAQDWLEEEERIVLALEKIEESEAGEEDDENLLLQRSLRANDRRHEPTRRNMSPSPTQAHRQRKRQLSPRDPMTASGHSPNTESPPLTTRKPLKKQASSVQIERESILASETWNSNDAEQDGIQAKACTQKFVHHGSQARTTHNLPARSMNHRPRTAEPASGRRSSNDSGASNKPVMPSSTVGPTLIPSKQNKAASASSTTPWVRRYLSTRPKDVLLPVPKEYIGDGFNLAQLAPIVERIGFQVLGSEAVEVAKRLAQLPPPHPSYPIYRMGLRLLLNENESEEAALLQHPLIPPHVIQQAAEALYLMIHARFVASPRGLDALRRILLNSPVFGKCPRIQCQGATLLPYGASNEFTGSHSCQRYCPCCGNLWNCWESKTDGCAWGPSLSHLLLLAHGTEIYASMLNQSVRHLATTEGTGRGFQGATVHPNPPTVFGFRIHPATTWGRPLGGE